MPGAIKFLQERVGFLDGVVMSGGECTLYPALIPLARAAKELGYEVKVDTNGTSPNVIRRMVEESLVDYIALDYKASRECFRKVTGRSHEFESFSETLDYLIEKKFPFEVRTTVHADIVDEEQVNAIGKDLKQRGYKGEYYLQHYFHTENNLGNIKEADREFDLSLIDVSIPIKLRNFPELRELQRDR